MNTARFDSPALPAQRIGGLRHQAQVWWFSLPYMLRSPAWFTTLSCLTILALLLAFHQVVRQAVQQGELLRMNTATHAEAVWRCNALRGPRVSAGCIEQLDAAPRNEAQTPPNTATARVQVAQLGR